MSKEIHLQGYGRVQATEAENLKIGSKLIWNFGETSKVIDITPKGKKQLTITEEYKTGVHSRVVSRTRLIGFISL